MVHDRQAERKVGSSTVDQRLPFEIPPPESRGRIGDVDDEGKYRALALSSKGTVDTVDSRLV